MEAYLAYEACDKNAAVAAREMFDFIRRQRPIDPKDPEKVQRAAKYLKNTAEQLRKFSNNLKKNKFRVEVSCFEYEIDMPELS